MYDPFNLFSPPVGPGANFGQQGFGPGARRPSPIQPLPPGEEDSLLTSVLGKAAGGLSYAAGSLGKAFGGRAIRGVLGGKPEELLSAIPFSDTLGLTSEANAVSGEDLAKKWGIISGEGEKGTFEARDLVGPAVEMALDPGSYLTFGGSALTKAGRVAEAAGLAVPKTGAGRAATTLGHLLTTPEARTAAEHAAGALGHTVADLEHLHLGGNLGLGLPFAHPSVTFDATPAVNAAKWAGAKVGTAALHMVPGGTKVAEWAGQALPAAGRGLRALFDPAVAGAVSEAGQGAGRAYTAEVERMLTEARGVHADMIAKAKAAGLHAAGADFRKMAEGVAPATPAAQAIIDQGRQFFTRLHANMERLGLHAPGELEDLYAEYWPRFQAQLERDAKGFTGPASRAALPTSSSALEGRETILKNIPGGTEAYNRLSADPAYSGLKATLPPDQVAGKLQQNADFLRRSVLGMTPAEEQALAAAQAAINANVPPAISMQEYARLKGLHDQASGLSDLLASLDPGYARKGVGFFSNHPLDDFLQAVAGRVKPAGAAHAVHDLFAMHAEPTRFADPGWVSVDEALKSAGFRELNLARAEFARRTHGLFGPGAGGAKDMFLPPDVVADATRFLQGHSTPEGLKPILNVLDSVTNLTKAGQTAPWPGFHARNFLTGLWQNAVIGAHDPRFHPLNPMAWLQPVQDARALLAGGEVADAAKLPLFRGLGLTDRQATDELSKLAYQHRVTGFNQAADAVGPGASQGQKLIEKLPGNRPFEGYLQEGWKGITGLAEKEGRNPLGVAGVGGRAADTFAPVVAGRKIGQQVEDTNRLSAFLAKLRQGYEPAKAAAGVRAAHFDYAALTPFERGVMKRLVPFYAYTRHNIPFQLQQLLERPGGLTAQAVKLAAGLRQQAGFVPPYLGGGLAVPVGQEEDGTQRFLTRLDLPHEQALEMFRPGPNALGDTGMALLGQLNPLIKAPLEMATGRQFYSGRELTDLYSPTGSTVAEQALMNSPLGRAYTTGRQLLDQRKGPGAKALNLLTGLKVSDVDMEKQRAVAARQIIQDELSGRPGIRKFTETYVRPEDVPFLSPEELLLLRLNKSLEQRNRPAARVGVRR